MKTTVQQLRQVIAEEVRRTLSEAAIQTVPSAASWLAFMEKNNRYRGFAAAAADAWNEMVRLVRTKPDMDVAAEANWLERGTRLGEAEILKHLGMLLDDVAGGATPPTGDELLAAMAPA